MAGKEKISNDELACVYSALILADDDIPVTTEKLNTILKAANVTVEPIWPSLFARALQGADLRELVRSSCGSGGLAGGAPAEVAPPSEKPVVQEEKKPEPVEEEDSDEDFGLSLFD